MWPLSVRRPACRVKLEPHLPVEPPPARRAPLGYMQTAMGMQLARRAWLALFSSEHVQPRARRVQQERTQRSLVQVPLQVVVCV